MNIKQFAGIIALCGAPLFAGVCTDLVTDADGLAAKNSGAVVTASAALVNRGAEPHVIVIRHIGTATLDQYEGDVEAACPEWRAPDGGRKNNLLVVLVAIEDRKTGMYFGSQWRPTLVTQWPRIQSAVMAPRFRDGDYWGGIAAGLAEVERLITTASSPTPAVIVEQQAPGAPTDLSGLWAVLFSTLGAVALWLVWRAICASRHRQIKDAGAQQAALIARDEATTLVAEATNGLMAYDAASNVTARRIIDAAVEVYSHLGSGSSDAARDGLGADQYAAIEKRYREVSTELRRGMTLLGIQRPDTASLQEAKSILEYARLREGHVPAPQHIVVTHHYDDGPAYIPVPIPVSDPEPVHYHSDPPAPASSPDSDSGGSSSWGSSDYSGGGSADFGSSGSGDGGSSSW